MSQFEEKCTLKMLDEPILAEYPTDEIDNEIEEPKRSLINQLRKIGSVLHATSIEKRTNEIGDENLSHEVKETCESRRVHLM